MSARTAMRHRCTIERNSATPDSWGGEGAPGWQSHLTAQPCRAWFANGRRVTPPGEDVSVLDVRLLLPSDTDVTKDDRVAAVADRLGRIVLQGPLQIDAIGRRANHLVLMLKETP